MFKNYFTVAVRNLLRSKVFSLINVVGLAFGLTCAMLIAAYVYDETHYDTYSPNAKNIYRVGLKSLQNDAITEYPAVDVAVGAGLKNAFPEIEEFTRLTGHGSGYVRHGDVQFKEEKIVLVDRNFFTVMGLRLEEGDPESALKEPNSIVITRAMAKKYFGEQSAMGETLTFPKNTLYKITGIVEPIPDNTHFHYDGFVSAATSEYMMKGSTWSNIGFVTYAVLNPNADVKALEAKIPKLVKEIVLPEVQRDMGGDPINPDELAKSFYFYLMPVTDIHLHSATKYEQEANGDINYIYIFTGLGVFILLLAGINFTNLSTATSARRSREVGIRKALGSHKQQLVNQFLLESVLLSMVAVGVALMFVFACLPLFNEITGKHFTILFFLNTTALPMLLLSGVLIGVLAGSYPAFFLSSFDTIRVLKGNSGIASVRRGGLRSGLVVFQFAISTALIVATVVVYQQLHYMQNIKLGYQKDQVLVIENGGALGNDAQAFKQTLLQDSRVTGVSITHDAPIRVGTSFNGSEINAKGENSGTIHTNIFQVDYDYITTMGMNIVIGRNFSKEFPSDSMGTVINETEMRELGWTPENVLGKIINRSGRKEYTVVGVVSDFHYASARQKIAPLLMLLNPTPGPLIVKVETKDISGFMADLKTKWTTANTGVPFDYTFLDDRFAQLYKGEQTVEKIFIVFVAIAIIIACLGLYGLSAFSAEQRVREIGIRKVLGSTVNQILFLLSKEFLYLVLIAIAFAIPVSWWAMHQWLQNFGYRVTINGWIFLLAGGTAVFIALVTISFQAVRAAVADPVKSLRSE